MKNKVSCITPTLNVLPKLKISINCYLGQTHPNKEMLILFYDHDLETKNYLLSLDKKWCSKNNIRLFHYKNNDDIKLGGVINFLVSQSKGEYIAIWDSDDWHSPERLKKQLSAIKRHKKISCTLHKILIRSEKYKDLRVSNSRLETGWEGTLLCKKENLYAYENIQSKYDSQLVIHLSDNDLNYVLKDFELYIYNIHTSHNCSSNEHLDNLYKSSKKTRKDYSYLENIYK
jgi:glycosyltransferase involved in cell wall biosynthesis